MADEKKIPENTELNEEQMDNVAGGRIYIPEDRLEPFNPPVVSDLPGGPLPYPKVPDVVMKSSETMAKKSETEKKTSEKQGLFFGKI